MTFATASAPDLDDRAFQVIAEFTYKEAGIMLEIEKKHMIQSRLRKRLRDLGISDFQQYSDLLVSDAGNDERRKLISALTTNVTHFFREQHHFDVVAEKVKDLSPGLQSGGRLRIWSAGCSNGQEPLSLAVTLLEANPQAGSQDVKILATDIDPEVIAFARRSVYPMRLADGLPAALKSRFFAAAPTDGPEEHIAPKSMLLDLIRYRELNLLGSWPMKGRFDVIMCRNVVIYFDLPTQERLWPRFREKLAPGGLLMIGHSERIAEPEKFGLIPYGTTTYRAQ